MVMRFFKFIVFITVGGFVGAGRKTEAEIMEVIKRAVGAGMASRGEGPFPSTIEVPPFAPFNPTDGQG